jgi:uncharacterized membrane protein YphA (DoxX/SURF4 family)
MLLCCKLWLNERNFPLVPLIDLHLPAVTGMLLLIASAALLVCISVFRFPQKFIIAFLAVALLMALQDQNRWQPWFYQYVLMLGVLAFFNFRCDNDAEQASILNMLRLMIAAIYFWSGLQKLNPHFPDDIFPWLMEPVTNHMAAGSISKFQWLSGIFPLIETGTGIALLIPVLRKYALAAVVIMHLFILFSLGPLGHNYNPVVWPWNIAMMAFCFLLFRGERMTLIQLRLMLRPVHMKLVFLLFVLMPLFNFFNLWDSYLSHNLYSGNTSNGVIYLSDSVEHQLPAAIKPYSIGELNQNQVTIKYWCMRELGVPAYPEKRNFEGVTKTFYPYAKDSSEIYLLFTPKLKAGEQSKQIED